ncbi:hypothetical protein B0T13DRAFT_440586 [Neurospora crassa]|nr:hypothetical protein B0T13DRAFT_440586 [Neurospora crassa]
MTALFNFQSLLLVIILLVCTSTYIHQMFPAILDRNKDGLMGIFWKCARIGERLSPYVSICCIFMASIGESDSPGDIRIDSFLDAGQQGRQIQRQYFKVKQADGNQAMEDGTGDDDLACSGTPTLCDYRRPELSTPGQSLSVKRDRQGLCGTWKQWTPYRQCWTPSFHRDET